LPSPSSVLWPSKESPNDLSAKTFSPDIEEKETDTDKEVIILRKEDRQTELPASFLRPVKKTSPEAVKKEPRNVSAVAEKSTSTKFPPPVSPWVTVGSALKTENKPELVFDNLANKFPTQPPPPVPASRGVRFSNGDGGQILTATPAIISTSDSSEDTEDSSFEPPPPLNPPPRLHEKSAHQFLPLNPPPRLGLSQTSEKPTNPPSRPPSQPEKIVIPPPRTTLSQPEKVVNPPPRTTLSQPEKVVNPHPRTTLSQPEKLVNSPLKTTFTQPEKQVISPPKTTLSQPEKQVKLVNSFPRSALSQTEKQVNPEKPLEQKSAQSTSPPRSPQQNHSSVDASTTTTSSSGPPSKQKKKSEPVSNSMVFNFVNTDKNVTHIENDGLDMSKRRGKNLRVRTSLQFLFMLIKQQ
jgi:hypothetical protein